MQPIRVKDALGVDFAILYPVAPQEDGKGWLSLELRRQGLTEAETVEFYTSLGNALAIMRGDVKVAA